MVAPADLALQLVEGDDVEDPSLLEGFDGVLNATHPVLASLLDQPVLALPFGPLLNGLELLHDLGLWCIGGDVFFGDNLFFHRLGESLPEFRSSFFWPGNDKVLDVVLVDELLCNLTHILVEAVYVRLVFAEGRVSVPRAATPRMGPGGLEIHLPEKPTTRPAAALRRIPHRGGDEEAELLSVYESNPVGLVFVEGEDQGRQVWLPEAVGLREFHLQIVALEGPAFGGEEDHGARPRMHLVLDRFSNALGYLLRHLHLLQCLPETHLK